MGMLRLMGIFGLFLFAGSFAFPTLVAVPVCALMWFADMPRGEAYQNYSVIVIIIIALSMWGCWIVEFIKKHSK